MRTAEREMVDMMMFCLFPSKGFACACFHCSVVAENIWGRGEGGGGRFSATVTLVWCFCHRVQFCQLILIKGLRRYFNYY